MTIADRIIKKEKAECTAFSFYIFLKYLPFSHLSLPVITATGGWHTFRLSEMLYATANFFLLTAVERSGVRSTEITAYATDYGSLVRVAVTALRTYEALAGTLKFTLVAAFVAFVDRSIGTIVRNLVI